MGCSGCGSGGGCGSSGSLPGGCENNGACMTSGCNKLDVYDWLSDMDLPASYKPFEIIEVRFKGSRKEFYINSENLYLEIGEPVVVEPKTGSYDIGHVSLTGELVRMQLKKKEVDADSVTAKVIRKANEKDIENWQKAKDMEWETMHKARKIAIELHLSMKISDVDYQCDRSKATFYYTADGRVDFRELIKRLAAEFRIRIEMRQIGMRQEAGRLGGIGSCGRELCCSTWLTDFKTVSTSAARYQNLSLNTLKIAGQCGKLKCCLNFELDTYMDALKDLPTKVDKIETKSGTAYLRKTDIFKKIMWFAYEKGENWIPIEAHKVKEYADLNRKGEKVEALFFNENETTEAETNKSFDYENVVGQDSLTRLDDKNQKTSKKRKQNFRNKRRGKDNRESKPKTEAKRDSKREGKREGRNHPNADNSSQQKNPKKRRIRRRNKGPQGPKE